MTRSTVSGTVAPATVWRGVAAATVWRGVAAATLLASLVACGDDDAPGDAEGPVTLVVYDSFPTADTPLNAALDAFAAETGHPVEILVAGDTGTMLVKAELAAGNPEGDVMWGIDTTFLSRAVEGDVFEPYRSPAIADVDPSVAELVVDDLVTPVDQGDVCVNYDIAWFADRGLAPPATFDDLADPAYAGLLTVQDAGASSPGLAFLLATVARYGVDGWTGYWERLVANDVDVAADWTEAYYERFSATGGDDPLVVSYGSSPVAEVVFADPPRDDAPTAVVADTCFRQVEFAGVLRGTDQPEAARALVDFLLSPDLQRELPLTLFVAPANATVELPEVYERFATAPAAPLTLEPSLIAAERATWIEQWADIVGR
ncbi:MAG: thiamine ABC transporter substrate-binding protein [Ilumatobacteraceae bacterium]|jgi:thiamine transport system substrate-binding protein|nr:thiamine ABC transporter substrate-binding protein [Ilumatobacteraceae bacterium]